MGDADQAPGAASDDVLTAALQAAERATATLTGGAVATYIPTLAQADPDRFGLAACTVSGTVSAVGDADDPFTMQSTSKAFAYAAALQRFGRDAMRTRVGVEPTGRSFDSIVRLESGTHRPHNPMINAGAIAVSALLAVPESPGAAPIAEMLALLGRLAARELRVDSATYLSERDTGHQNRAIAYLLRHHGVFDGDVGTALDLYFQQCSVEVCCRDLAMMAGTLAAGGRNPRTGEQVLAPDVVCDVLAVMSTCGLYDAAGWFLYEVGLPAKSGVSGAVMAVVPGRMGLAAWSPRLDTRGNPVRGVAAIREVAAALDLHVFSPRPAPQVGPARLDGAFLQGLVDEIGPNTLGVSVVGIDGRVVQAGPQTVFALQATANAFAHALALERHGTQCVQALGGVEPSGNPFHAIFLDGDRRRPHNPLGNAGAIALCSLVPGKTSADRVSAQLNAFAQLAGVPRLEVDALVLDAERQGGDRNRAIANMLRAHGVLDDIEPALELYFHQCSIRATPVQLAQMAAVLAGGGVVPGGGQRLLRRDVVQQSLSVMYTCGLHDESGRFAYDVGIPAKTGVSGAIVAVAPGRMGIAVHCAGVNECGTSVAGRALLIRLARELQLSVFRVPSPASDLTQ